MKYSESSSERCHFLADRPAVCSQIYGKIKGPVTLNDRHTRYSSMMESCSPLFSAGEEKLCFCIQNIWMQRAVFL